MKINDIDWVLFYVWQWGRSFLGTNFMELFPELLLPQFHITPD